MSNFAFPYSDTEPSCSRIASIDRSLQGVIVIIPALNEENSLPLVLRDLPPVGRVVVVDNGSTDNTTQVACQLGAQVVFEGRRGYGAACLAGLAAVERAVLAGTLRKPDMIAFLDADYSDHVHLLPRLVAPILSKQAEFVLGSRLLGQREPGAMPPQSVWGNRFACFLIRCLWGASFSDLGPFRIIRYDALESLKMEDQSFGWTIEMQIKAVVAGLRIKEISVPYRCRIGQSKISGTLIGSIKAGYKILFTIAKYKLSDCFSQAMRR